MKAGRPAHLTSAVLGDEGNHGECWSGPLLISFPTMKKRRTVGDGALDCAEVINWRKAERQRLIAEPLDITGDIPRRHDGHIAASLDEVIGEVRGRVISAYWPFRGEPDLRGFMGRILSRAGRCALPGDKKRGKPLFFRPWSPGEPLAKGVWNIPVPASTEEV